MNKRLNILYIISSFRHGRGGHFYSLRATAAEMSKVASVSIVSVGTAASPVYDGMNNYTAIKTKWPGPTAIEQVIRQVRKQEINVIHAFDSLAYFFARIASLVTGVPVLLTKPGGPPPKRYFPRARDLVLFSTEDMGYFKKSSRYRKTNLYHIPNRVSVIEQDLIAIQILKERLRKNAKIILRIARFSKLHEKSILDSMALLKRLRSDNVDVQLLLVGVIGGGERVYEGIVSRATSDVVIATEDTFTINASRIIGVADIVVGTGRGAMEAAMQGKALLSPAKDMPIPILVAKDNVDHFLDFNFSERAKIESISPEQEYVKIKDLLSSDRMLSEQQSFMADYAQRHFDISSVREKYETIYGNCRRCEMNVIDSAMNCIYYCRNVPSDERNAFKKKKT